MRRRDAANGGYRAHRAADFPNTPCPINPDGQCPPVKLTLELSKRQGPAATGDQPDRVGSGRIWTAPCLEPASPRSRRWASPAFHAVAQRRRPTPRLHRDSSASGFRPGRCRIGGSHGMHDERVRAHASPFTQRSADSCSRPSRASGRQVLVAASPAPRAGPAKCPASAAPFSLSTATAHPLDAALRLAGIIAPTRRPPIAANTHRVTCLPVASRHPWRSSTTATRFPTA